MTDETMKAIEAALRVPRVVKVWESPTARAARLRKRSRRKPQRRPVYGSAEWAETRGDDLGESGDW